MLAGTFRQQLRHAIEVDDVLPVGGIRRVEPEVSGVAVLIIAPSARHDEIARVALPLAETPRGRIAVSVADPAQAGAALVWHTGSRAHLDALVARAHDRQLIFDATGLSRNGSPLPTATEADCYAALGLPVIPPELRQTGEEVRLAEAGQLPDLVTSMHIRGDLHMHTTWSDGRDTVEAMVVEARQLGYEYLAITDHSERSAAARKLTAGDVARQRVEIEEIRRRVPGIQVLHGVEVDIMPDGSLDFDDSLLASFDLVLASLHDRAGHEAARLTERCLAAIAHPLVSIITHPANRSPGLSPGYDLDFDRVFDAAVATGTALEIDGAPGHLDLDGTLARRAVERGVTLVIDSDAHRADGLRRQMRFGVGTARRGWVEPRHVLNSRSVDDVRAFVARKRARA
jgi:DNA polymerase (family 10)